MLSDMSNCVHFALSAFDLLGFGFYLLLFHHIINQSHIINQISVSDLIDSLPFICLCLLMHLYALLILLCQHHYNNLLIQCSNFIFLQLQYFVFYPFFNPLCSFLFKSLSLVLDGELDSNSNLWFKNFRFRFFIKTVSL